MARGRNQRLGSGKSLCGLGAAILSFAVFGQATKDPLNDFCRRWGHQTAVIGRKLYIDGGIVNWNPLPQNPGNFTNTGLLYNDLDAPTTLDGMPQLHANLNKSSNVPSVSGGILWEDDVNKVFYLFGGEYKDTPEDFTLWGYDTLLDQWNQSAVASSTAISRVSYGAGTSVNETGIAYYYGGWLNNKTLPGYNGQAMATSTLIQYDMVKNRWKNNTGPDNIGRAEGAMVSIPASDGGMLIYFGGISTPYGNETVVGEPMDVIRIYDVANSKWYTQNATGQVPEKRRRFCAGVTWAADRSSYNVYLYGGMGMAPNTAGFDDVYILSMPSFTWLKWYPTDPSAPAFPHHSLSCNVISGSQMLIIGGTFETSDACDAPSVWGTHNLNLGKDDATNSLWAFFNPNLTSYKVPPELLAKIGGNSLGSATNLAPSVGWFSGDLKVYFSRMTNYKARAATRYFPTTGPSHDPTSAQPHRGPAVGAIVGGCIGGAALALLLGGLLFLLYRRRVRRNSKQRVRSGPIVQPAELPSSNTPSTSFGETVKFDSRHSPASTHAYTVVPAASPPPPMTQSPVPEVGRGGISPMYHQPIPGYYHQIPAAQPYYPPPGTQPLGANSALFANSPHHPGSMALSPPTSSSLDPSLHPSLQRWASKSDLHAQAPLPNPQVVAPPPPAVPEKHYELAGERTPKPQKRQLRNLVGRSNASGSSSSSSQAGPKAKADPWL